LVELGTMPKESTMTKRELYRDKYQAQLHEWSAKLEELSAHQDKLTADAKIAAQPHLEGVKKQLEHARAKLVEMAEATDDKWDEFVTGVDKFWSETKAAFEGAYDAIRATPETAPSAPSAR
jgi:predicted  nucleic acid-binding Zn-ribbon protein